MKKISYLSFLMLITSTPVWATQVQQDRVDLLGSCRALGYQADLVGTTNSASACHYYIQGILANAYFSDSTGAVSFNDGNTQALSYVQRAYKTRIGTRNNTQNPVLSNDFCLPESESMNQVIKALSKPLQSEINSYKDLNTKIFYTLKAQYPCT